MRFFGVEEGVLRFCVARFFLAGVLKASWGEGGGGVEENTFFLLEGGGGWNLPFLFLLRVGFEGNLCVWVGRGGEGNQKEATHLEAPLVLN